MAKSGQIAYLSGMTRIAYIAWAAGVGLVLAALVPPFAGQGGAQSLYSSGESFAQVSLLPGEVAEDGSRLIGLAISLSPGWKTYWRSPGEAGVPPQFDFSASGNLASAEVYWPRPGLFESFGMTTVGYEGGVVLPVRLLPEDAEDAISLAVSLTLGVCKNICVFEETSLAAVLAPDLAADAAIIADAVLAVPPQGIAAGLVSASCAITGSGAERLFQARLAFDGAVQNPVVLLEGRADVWFHDEVTTSTGSEVAIEAQVSLLAEEAWISRGDVRMTLLADGKAADIQGCAAG